LNSNRIRCASVLRINTVLQDTGAWSAPADQPASTQPAEPPPQTRLKPQRIQLRTNLSFVINPIAPQRSTELHVDKYLRQRIKMANAHTINDSFQAEFDTAIQEFRVELKNDNLYRDILQTKNVEELYDVTDKLQEEQSKTGRLRHLSKIEPFLEGLRRYASVIEIFMQAKPDVLALIWGPIKLLLQWADVMKQSMDAIVDTIADIGSLIPEFRMTSSLFGEKAAIRDVLLLFFRDILDFYVIALKFFSNTRE
jgi:hypothetical protein